MEKRWRMELKWKYTKKEISFIQTKKEFDKENLKRNLIINDFEF